MPTLQPGSTSQAFDVDIGQTVSVTPGSGGTMLVEYTTNSETDIRNGSATWQAWTAGTVSSATSDVAMFPLFARVTAYTAAGSYELSGSGLRAVPNQYLAWKSDVVSARDPVSAAAVVGATISRTGDGPPQIILPGETLSFVSTFPWSSLPAAADYIGVAYVSDVGPHGSYWQSDGAAWGLVGGSCIVASSAVASSALTGSVSETTMASIAMPANLLGPNGALDIETKWSTNNDASSKTWYARFDSTLVAPGIGLASGLSSGSRATIQNRNSASSQIGGNGGVSGYAPQSSAWTTSTFNTATAFVLNIRAALSDAADTMTLESYRVTLIRP